MFARGLQLIALAALIAATVTIAGGTAPAAAQGAGPFGGFKHDSSALIEIVADALEVQQAENLAIFSGEVVAAQGTLRLTTDLLTVTYAAEESDTAANSGANASTDAGCQYPQSPKKSKRFVIFENQKYFIDDFKSISKRTQL